MKTASSLLQRMLGWEIISPYSSVCAIYSYHGVTRIDPPRYANELKCPECGFEKGISYYEKDDLFGFICAGECSQRSPKPQPPPMTETPIISMESMGVPRPFWDASLDGSYLIDRLKKGFQGWASNPRQLILLAGASGRGKSWTAAATMDAYRRQGGCEAEWRNCSQLFYTYQQECTERHGAYGLMNQLARRKLLVLDDLGDKEPSPGYKDFLYTLIERRNSADVGTIVCTNMKSEHMYEQYGDRIASRLLAGYKVAFDGGDYRNSTELFTKTSWE